MSFIRSAGWMTTTLPRPRAEVVVREGDRRAHRLDADVLARLALAAALAALLASLPPGSQPSDFAQRLGHEHQQVRMRARRDAAGSSRSDRRADRRSGELGRLAQPALRERRARARTGRRCPARGSAARGACWRRERGGAARQHGKPARRRRRRLDPLGSSRGACSSQRASSERRSVDLRAARRAGRARCRCGRCAPAPRACAPA